MLRTLDEGEASHDHSRKYICCYQNVLPGEPASIEQLRMCIVMSLGQHFLLNAGLDDTFEVCSYCITDEMKGMELAYQPQPQLQGIGTGTAACGQ